MVLPSGASAATANVAVSVCGDVLLSKAQRVSCPPRLSKIPFAGRPLKEMQNCFGEVQLFGAVPSLS